MSENCCQTSAEGNTFCIVSAPEMKQDGDVLFTSASPQTAANFWSKIRGGLMFGVACLTSPCCAPLYVPLGLTLLAGTPAAAWLAYYLSWVYGILTLVSLISFVLAWRWLGGKATTQPSHGEKIVLEENPQRTGVRISFDH